MRVRRRYAVLAAIALVALALAFAHPRLRSLVRAVLRRHTGPCLLLCPAGCAHADRVEVLANGQVIGSFGEEREGRTPRAPRIVFLPTGDTVFTFRLTRDGELLYKEPTFRAGVRQGDMFHCSFQLSDEEPTGYYGPRPSGSSPAVVEGVPAKVWCWFGRADHLHTDRLQVTLRGNTASRAFKRRAWWRGFRIVMEGHFNAGKTPVLTLVRPWDMTIVEAVLELETWEGVRSVGPEVRYVY